MALGRAPELRLAVLGDAGDAGVGLDVALVHGLGLVLALEDDVGLAEPGVRVAELELNAFGDVRRLVGCGVDAVGVHVVVEDGGVLLHGLDHVDDVGQGLVLDRDQVERVAGDGGAGRRHGGHRVAVVEDLVTGHDVERDVAIVDLHLAGRHELGPHLAEVRRGDHGLDAGQRLGPTRVDGLDAGVGVGAAQDPADQHAGQVQVGAELGAPRDLVDAIGPDRARAHPFQFLRRAFRVQRRCHGQAPLSSVAVSSTARMILS